MVKGAFARIFLGGLLVAGSAAAAAAAQPALTSFGVINDSITTSLPPDFSPSLVNGAHGAGRLSRNTPFSSVLVTFRRSAAAQAALDSLAAAQIKRGSPEYHKWLTPSDLKAYGTSISAQTAFAGWAKKHGLQITFSPSGMTANLSGYSGNFEAAFHTEMHYAFVNGAKVTYNTGLAIPTALSGLVSGVTLSNVPAHTLFEKAIPQLTAHTTNGTFYAVSPGDFATIYNTRTLLNGTGYINHPITGAGATIAVVERTRMLHADWERFREAFGLSAYTGTLTYASPGGCASPGFNADEGEAALDTEWTTGVAPNANVIEAACADGAPFDFGVFTSFQNLVELPTPANILSVSYLAEELPAGYAFSQAWNNLAEEGALEGKSIFVASGDSGSSGQPKVAVATLGVDVNALADSTYVTSVGGTDFYDSALKQNSKYWAPSSSLTGESALSYIPELTWNNSCASNIVAQFVGTTTGQLCNEAPQPAYLQNGVGGGGGQSFYYAKPSWQATTLPGMPNDGRRDQPDVSLFAGNGIWGHFLVYCMSDASEKGLPCHYKGNGVFNNAAGGTSFAAPAMAGIFALVAQSQVPYAKNFTLPAKALGNVAPTLYAIAQAQYATTFGGLNQCNSSLGNQISIACVFNIVTAGTNSEPCVAGTLNCPTVSGEPVGILTANVYGQPGPAYTTDLGYSLANGLGSVNAANLLYQF